LALAKRCGDRYKRPNLLARDLRLAAHDALSEDARATAREVAALSEELNTRRIVQPSVLH
jgi:hypothetical protein